ncbi:AbgT family transporter [Conexibacter sp. JD483]|uniref:AbgT family transporter n=1 Tax=unclassified Conexibacter TaxID=2627773 RepID=UPI00271B008B|nr:MULTISPECIES: AbgT family transporter [unclassified Conexibacter]MDO8188755.1 AbgT family transporter [Conexibacter sp. CPCC 205706]MDO8199907.1 AbgT family transporter [Conexibacter sp. CPCC 205762]MDR9371168.1 AbgT family transporter [Conexibacter sp. JD483]
MSAATSGHVDGSGGFGEQRAAGDGGFAQRALAWVERAGNKVPNPAILFLGLCVGVIVLSQLLDWIGVSVSSEVIDPGSHAASLSQDGVSSLPAGHPDYHVETETFAIRGLLTVTGIRFMFTSFVPNFLGFTAMGVILVAMIGVGVAELSGLVGGLIRKLVAISTPASLTFIIVFVGIVSSIAADAGYLVLIPLAATAFLSVGRHPLAGIAAGFGAVSAAFGVNILIVPADAVITDITNEAAALVDPGTRIDLVANLFFGAGCTIFLTIVIALVTTKIIEPRLGTWDRSLADEDELAREEGQAVDAALEAKGLRWAGLAVLLVLAVVAALTLPSGAPLRNPDTNDIIGDSPFMSSLIVIISAAFLAAGIAYGKAVGTIRGSNDVLGMITRSWASLASLLFLFLLIAQFIAYFDYSNIAQVVAVSLGDVLEDLDLGDLWLLLGVMVVTIVVNFVIPAKIAKWAILAPIFVPLMLRLGIEPQTVLAAYRVGDSPTNVLTPLMPYFALIVVFAQRYQRDAGIGTVIALMIPYTLVLTVAWVLFFVAWYLLGIPLGPGAPIR